MHGSERATMAHAITVELLSQIVDTFVEMWPLVGHILGALKISPKLLRYRSDVYGAGPVIAPQIKMTEKPIVDWFAYHGYEYHEMVRGKSGSGVFVIFRAADMSKVHPSHHPGQPAGPPLENGPITYKVPLVILFLSEESKFRKDNTPHVEAATFRDSYAGKGGSARFPIFVCLKLLPEFDIEWERSIQYPDIYPCLEEFFNLGTSENLMYPRFIPTVTQPHNVPLFHPGASFYSKTSAPLACNSLMFSANNVVTDFFVVRESHHKAPIIQFPNECYRIAV